MVTALGHLPEAASNVLSHSPAARLVGKTDADDLTVVVVHHGGGGDVATTRG